MPNNVAVSITADVADLQVKRAIMSAELKTATKDLNDFAKTASKSGATTELRTGMLGAADAAARARNQISLVDRDLRGLAGTPGLGVVAAGAKEAQAAVGGLHAGSAGVTRELIVMGREAARGNFSRLAGSATILLGRLGLLTPAILLTAAEVAAMAAPFLIAGAAMESSAADAAHFNTAIELSGNYSGVTGAAYEEMARKIAEGSNSGVGAARGALMELVQSGRFTGDQLVSVGVDALKFAQMTHQSSAEVIKDFVKMTDEPSRWAEEFSRAHHSFSSAQLEEIQLLEQHGDKAGATAAAIRDLTVWIGDQTVHLGPLAGAWHAVAEGIDDAWQAFKRMQQGPTDAQKLAADNASLAAAQHGGARGVPVNSFLLAQLQKERDALQAKVNAENAAAAATAKAAQVQQQGADAYDASHKTMESLRSSASAAKDAVAALHDEMAKRLAANPQDKEALDYQANQAKYDQALLHKMDPGDNKKPKKPKDDDVSEWTKQLEEMKAAQENWYKDENQLAVAFWSKIVAGAQGSAKDQQEAALHLAEAKEALDKKGVESAIDAAKRQADAAAGNVDKVKAIYAGLEVQLAKVHQQGGEEWKRVEDDKAEAVKKATEEAAKAAKAADTEALAELKSNLDTEQSIRAAAARTQESILTSKAAGNPLAEVGAAVQVASIKARLAQQDMAADETKQKREDAILQDDINAAEVGSAAYVKAVEAKKLADLEFANKHRELEDQVTQQSILAAQEIQQKWQGITQPIGSSFAQMFQGMYMRQETFAQAAMKLGDQLLFKFVDVAMQDLAKWTATQLAKTTAITAQTAIQTSTQAAGAAAGAAAQKMANASTVTQDAKVAAAGAYAAVSSIPVVGPLLAPEAAAAAFVAVEAFGSFDKGLNVVPNDMLAQIHAGERIMPASDNRAIMAAVSRGTGGAGGAGASVTAHFNNTFHGVSPHPEELVGLMMPELVKRFTKMQERGMFK